MFKPLSSQINWTMATTPNISRVWRAQDRSWSLTSNNLGCRAATYHDGKINVWVYHPGNYCGHIQTPHSRLHLAGRGFEPGTS